MTPDLETHIPEDRLVHLYACERVIGLAAKDAKLTPEQLIEMHDQGEPIGQVEVNPTILPGHLLSFLVGFIACMMTPFGG